MYMGDWDASAGTFPPNPNTGQLYRISVAGTISGYALQANDAIYYDGSTWQAFYASGDAAKLEGHPASYFWNTANTRVDQGIISKSSGAGAGTAATKDVQTGPLDNTNGRVLATGAFGLGQGIILTSSDNLNAVTAPGFYRWSNSVPVNSPSGLGFCSMLVLSWGDGANQLVETSDNTVIYRSKKNSQSPWSSWREVLLAGDNIPVSDVTGAAVVGQEIEWDWGTPIYTISVPPGDTYPMMPGDFFVVGVKSGSNGDYINELLGRKARITGG